jgi:proteasome lid subunit RPN8/RPN11
MADSFSLEKKYADKMIDHGRREAANECCGILAGTNDHIIKIYQTTNAAHSPSRYRTDPQEMLAIYEEIRENKWQILGIYHSHTQTSAYPSTTDIKCAVLSGPIYFILSMKNPDQPVIRGFRILEGMVTETELRIVES